LQTQARAHLLNVGIIRPKEELSAIDINAFLSRPEGAPPSVGKIADPDKIDVARFLNRYCLGLSCLFALCMRELCFLFVLCCVVLCCVVLCCVVLCCVVLCCVVLCCVVLC